MKFGFRDNGKLRLCALISFLFSTLGYGQEKVGKVDWEYDYVDMNASCKQYLSLYPPSVKCIEDRLYAIRYKISYVFRGERRKVYLDYIPDTNTPIDVNGNLEPRNHIVKERY